MTREIACHGAQGRDQNSSGVCCGVLLDPDTGRNLRVARAMWPACFSFKIGPSRD
jgi:hypothetical protein